jgi:PTH1 family peptidyl-tRNA hydrolase
MHYIVGLGNPGEEYLNTRHNVGFAALEYVIQELRLPSLVRSSKYGGQISEGVIGLEDVTLLLPETFMNKSGSAVTKLVPKEAADHLTVVYDDVDLPLGEIKISFSRGSGGHNGIKSIIESLGTKDFVRVRLGVASKGFFGGVKRPQGEKLARHVLGKFKRGEQAQLDQVLKRTVRILRTITKDGVEQAMNEFNSNE